MRLKKLRASHLTDDVLLPIDTTTVLKTKRVVELLTDHYQDDCEMIPAGTRAVVNACRADGDCVLLFPHSPTEMKVFGDGRVRIVRTGSFRVIGRIVR